MRKLFGGLFLLMFVLLPSGAFAESYDVTASVAAPLPLSLPLLAQPPTPQQAVSGMYITGTCEVVVPTLIVVLIRNNETIGSGNCLPDGTFKVFVGLVLGVNTIYARYVTITGQTGSLGAPITFVYNPPQNTQQKTENNTETPDSTAKGLQLIFDYDFVSYDDTSKTEISYGIEGGTAPYTVQIAWGDGTQTTQKQNTAGTFSVTHQYKTILEPSQITVQVVDVSGTKKSASRALVSFRRGVYVPAAQPGKAEKNKWPYIWGLGAFTFSAIVLIAKVNVQHVEWFRSHKKKRVPLKKVTRKKR